MHLEFRHLRTIKAIHEAGGLARAADQLNITQSALSHQVKGLEDQIGVPLFVRRSKPLRLSAAGQRLLKTAERVLAEMEALEEEFRALEDGDGPLELPVETEDPDLVERVAVSRHVADLMLADEWTEVGTQIAEWESHLASAPGGARYHDVGVDVALSGLQSLIDDAPFTALGNLDAAEAEVGHFIDTYQRNTDSHVLAALAARAHLALEAPEAAEALLREALALAPSDPDLHLDLARVLAALGRSEEAAVYESKGKALGTTSRVAAAVEESSTP